MVDSEELFLLIKSLSKSEKKYFKDCALKDSHKDHNYIKVFNEINKQAVKHTSFNAEKLKESLTDKAILKNLSQIKNYLYHAILRALISYSTKSSPGYKISRLIDSIEMLNDKGLYKNAYKLLKTARKAVVKDHMNEYELILNNLEMTIIKRLGYSRMDEPGIKQMAYDNKVILNKISNYSDYRLIGNLFYLRLAKQAAPDTAEQMQYFDTLMKNPLLKDNSKALSLAAQKEFYDLSAHYRLLKNDFEGSIGFIHKMLDMYEANPRLKYQTFLHYYSVIHNLLLCLVQLKRYGEAERYIAELKNEVSVGKIKLNDLMRIRYVTLYQIELLVYLNSGEFEKMPGILSDINDTLDKYKNKLGIMLRFSMTYSVSCCFFGMGKYDEALNWVNKLIRKDTGELPTDYDILATMLKVMIHYELKDYDYLQYFTLSFQNTLIKSKNKKFVEYHINSLIRKIVLKEPDKKQMQYLFAELYNNYTSYPSIHKELSINPAAWLQSKIEEKSYADIIKAKNINKRS